MGVRVIWPGPGQCPSRVRPQSCCNSILSLFFKSVPNTATAFVLHAVAVVLRYMPFKIYLPFMFWVFQDEGAATLINSRRCMG